MSQEQHEQQLQRLTDQVQTLTAELATQRLDSDAAKNALEQQTQTLWKLNFATAADALRVCILHSLAGQPAKPLTTLSSGTALE